VKRLIISMLVAILMIAFVAVPCFAADPTTTTVTWNGGGIITGVVNTGATTSAFGVNATSANGTFTATDSNDNPYSYGVDSNSAYINGSIVGGGEMYFQTVRNVSYVPMYGVAGQSIYNYIGTSGTGAMATGSGTNYAAMGNGTYGQSHTAGGYNFEASGSSGYRVIQTISSINSIAQFVATGTGTSGAVINSMTTGASGASVANLGWGGGCYTNANAIFTGAGNFAITATGANGITTPIAGANGVMVAGGWTASGASSLSTIMSFTNGGSVGNFSVATW
jgi:hypothetical protein